MQHLLNTKGKRKVFLDDKNQFGVFLTPTLVEGEWTGEVEVNLAFADNNDLDDDCNEMLVQVIAMMAASVELMETDSAIADRLMDIVDRRYPQSSEKEQLTKDIEIDGNVIRFDFNSKTKGNA